MYNILDAVLDSRYLLCIRIIKIQEGCQMVQEFQAFKVFKVFKNPES